MKRHVQFLYLLLLTVLTGCQTAIESVGDNHFSSAVKWKQLASYTGDELLNSGYTITGNLRIKKQSDISQFVLTDIKLVNLQKLSGINLLSPSFRKETICGEKCHILSSTKSDKSETVLTQFLRENEAELFEFYGRLTLLNKKLIRYGQTERDLLINYLNWIVKKNQIYSTPLDFIADFETYINDESITAYVESKGDLNLNKKLIAYDDFDKSMYSEGENVPNPTDDWFDEGVVKPTLDEQLIERAIIESENMLPYSVIISKNWQESKKRLFDTGDIVCTFSDNVFGVVEWVEQENVSIARKGIANRIVDGVKVSAMSGHLFSHLETFYFSKLDDSEVYNKSDVATCAIGYME